MSSTSPLTVLGDFSMDEKTINMHPNDGFDLGLMTTEHVVRIHVGEETESGDLPDDAFTYGKLHLKNEVRNGYLELGLKSAEKLGAVKKAIVHYEKGDRYGTLLVTPA
ncbi:MAG TPA: hypothetical protein VKA06_00120 [Spirochaetia bacterium]|nr:hypothetical protein [Spirochaetia bacterium]